MRVALMILLIVLAFVVMGCFLWWARNDNYE